MPDQISWLFIRIFKTHTYVFLQVQNKERENLELQSEMADARKKHEVNIKFHDSISCNIYAVTTYLPSNQYTGGPPLTRIQCTK